MSIPRGAFVAGVIAAMIAAVAAGCRAPTTSESAALTSTAPESTLTVTVTLDRAAFAPGDALQATVVARNTSGAAVRLTGSSGCVAGLDVQDADGRVVAHGDYRICQRDLVAHVVAPGATLTDRPVWTGEARLPAQGFVPPGVYAVRGFVRLVGGQEVMSAPVSLTVTAR